jgi:hypothetical protein
MAIESRRNGNLYYYRKRREGSRVVSEYVGGGVLVELEQYRAEQERALREAERERLRIAKLSMAEVDAQIGRFSRMVDELVRAELIAAGYHQHKRQWRRRRESKHSTQGG